MQHLLGDEYESFQESYSQTPSAGLRVNTLKLTPEQFQTISPYPLSPIPWCPSGFRIDKETIPSPGKHPYHAAGLYYLQDPSAMAVAELLAPQPGEMVLDLAAAPGGKTTHLACLMQDRGVLIANEMHPKRAWELAENLERWGTRNTAILNETPSRLADAFGDIFDKVLLDAPCSGEGMFRKSKVARQEWSIERVASCAVRQSAILREASRLVRPGGTLAYATCTFSVEENEMVIARFLKDNPAFELVEGVALPGSSRGRPEWIEATRRVDFPNSILASLGITYRLWPHENMGEGHFIAVLQRATGKPERKRHAWEPPAMSPEAARFFHEFCRETLTDGFHDRMVTQIGAYVYAIPPGLPDLQGSNAIHPGLWLGVVKKGRFEPSHALAMATKSEQIKQCIGLEPQEAIRFLQGNTLEKDGIDGWVCLTIDGFPLGWGKRTRGMIKNFYPKGLRW
jgi:NOL1/NOP2/sun family putative RNA methylase